MSLFDIFRNNAQTEATRNQIYGYNGQGGILNAVNQAQPQYQAGISQLQNYGAQALGPLGQNFGALSGGVSKLGDLLGLGGQAGTQGALKALEDTPGYRWQLEQINNQQLAQDAATGGTGSGNQAIALQNRGQNLASTYYQNAVQNLMPYLTGAQNTASQIATTNMGIGQGTQAGYNNMGNMLYGANTSIGNAGAQVPLGNLSGSANSINALMGLGGGLLGFLSDIRVKEDVAPVGALASGETVYRYRYAGDPRHQIGLIAQEVEGATPEAVFDAIGDLKGVDYRRATERAARILEFSRERGEPVPMHRPFASELMELAA